MLGFPGLFKGALAARAPRFTDAMLLAAARTIAELAKGEDLVPDPLDLDMHQAVAAAGQPLIAIRELLDRRGLDLADALGGNAVVRRRVPAASSCPRRASAS